MIFASIMNNQLWYLLPLLVTVSLVYGGTRHEFVQPILVNAYKSAAWMLSFMAIVFAVLSVATWLLG